MDLNNVTIVYGFDSESELEYWEFSLKSLIRSNGPNLNVLTIVSSNELRRKVFDIYSSLDLNKSFNSIALEGLDKFKFNGQFYWIKSPFYVNTKYVLQLDNDILINGSVSNLLENTITKDKKIWGVRVRISEKEKMLKTLIKIHEFNLKKSIRNKWVNAGVVLMDADWFKQELHSDQNLTNMINEFCDISFEKPFAQVADESFIIKYFHNQMGRMPAKWNLRFQSPKATRKNINNKEWFFHFNLRRKEGNKYIKYNFNNLLLNGNPILDKESQEITNFLIERYKKERKPYLKVLVRNDVKKILKNIIEII